MPESSKLKSTRAILSRFPSYSITKVEEIDGKIKFINIVTGQTFEGPGAFDRALAYADILRIADFREIDKSGNITTGRITGSSINADRVVKLNTYLSDPANRATLALHGLEDLSGGSVSGRMVLFDTKNKVSAVENIQRTISEHMPGEVVLTDGGLQLFSLSQAVTSSGATLTLSRAQQEILKQLSGTKIFKSDTVDEFFSFLGQALSSATSKDEETDALKGIGKIVGKMSKRYQSMFSSRDVSVGNQMIQELIDAGNIDSNPYFMYDRVEAMLQTIAGGYDSLPDPEKVVIAPALKAAEQADIGFITTGMPVSHLSENIFVPRKAESAAEVAFQLLEEQLQLRVTTSISGVTSTHVPDAFVGLSSELRAVINTAFEEKQRGRSGSLLEIIQGRYLSPELRKIVDEKLEAAAVSSVDGHYIQIAETMRRIILVKQKQIQDIKSSGIVTPEDLSNIRELENELEALQTSIKSGDRNPFRVSIPGVGGLKGEAAVKSSEDILGMKRGDLSGIIEMLQELDIDGYDSLTDEQKRSYDYLRRMLELQEFFSGKITVADKSALKRETVTSTHGMAGNIAIKKGSQVYVEDMLLLNDPEFLMSATAQKRIQAMIDSEVRAAQKFMETGEIPEEVLGRIRREATMVLDGMDPTTRALELIRRKQVIEISQALRSGVDPRRIPALVNMISNYHISEAFMTKEGIIATRIPDALRYKIATRSSLLEPLTEVEYPSISHVDVFDSAGKKTSLPAVDFLVSGKQMIVSDSITSTYKAAEGTFDLDDSVLPILRTYVDAQGRTRIAAVVMRDPKGYQESILMRPKLSHVETLRAMFIGDSDKISKQVASATSLDISSLATRVSNEAGIGQNEALDIVNVALNIIRGDKGIDERVLQETLTGIKSRMGAEANVGLEATVRIIREGMYGERLGVDRALIPSIDTNLLDALTERQSAAIRGLDVLDEDGLPIGALKTLSPERGAPYADRYRIELQSSADQVSSSSLKPVKQQLLDSLGITDLDDSELGTLFKTSAEGDALRAKLGLNFDQVAAAGEKTLLDYVFQSTGEKLDDIENSIGLTINRMASASYIAPQVRDFETTLNQKMESTFGPGAKITKDLLGDEGVARFGIGVKAPSDIVDLINQMSGTTKLASLGELEKELGSSSPEFLKMKAAYETIAKFSGTSTTAEDLHKISVTPGMIARASVEQQGRILARQRAMGIALGVSAEDLPGFDPLILDSGGRLNIKNDILELRNSMVEEYQDVITQLRAAGMSSADLAKVQSEIDELKVNDIDQIKRILSLSQKGIDRYGSITKAREIAIAGDANLRSQAPKPSTSNRVLLRSVSDPRYSDSAKGFLRTEKIRSLFTEINNMENEAITGKKLEKAMRAKSQQLKTELSIELSKGLRVIQEAHRGSGANILDIVETFEAEMQGLYGSKASRLMQYSGHEGEEDLMIQLQQLSAARKNLRLTSFDPRGEAILSGYFDNFRKMTLMDKAAMTDLGGSISDNILDISAEEARRILHINEERIKNRTKTTTYSWYSIRSTCFRLFEISFKN
jgi:hypothetical protein